MGRRQESTMDRHAACVKKRGVEFIEENGGGPGVRLRKRAPKLGK